MTERERRIAITAFLVSYVVSTTIGKLLEVFA